MSACPRCFVILGVYNPIIGHLEQQIASILGQTVKDIELIVVPDGPQEEAERVIAGYRDSRIRLCRQDTHVGVYHNFQRGLETALTCSDQEVDLFAYCDQDDIWVPHKLQRQIDALAASQAVMCYCDAKVVDDAGTVVYPSLFDAECRVRNCTVSELVLENSVTGMTMLFDKRVAQAAVNYPARIARHVHHDWWTALVAKVTGPVVFIDEPLVAYRQHSANVIGAQPWMPQGSGNRKRPFLSREYREMCVRHFVTRRFLVSELARLADQGRQVGQSTPVLRGFTAGRGGAALLLATTAGMLIGGRRRCATSGFRSLIGRLEIARRVFLERGPLQFRSRYDAACEELLAPRLAR